MPTTKQIKKDKNGHLVVVEVEKKVKPSEIFENYSDKKKQTKKKKNNKKKGCGCK
mgnify:CR=1 FL=1